MLVSSLTKVKGAPLNNKGRLSQIVEDLKLKTTQRGAQIVGLLKKGSARFGPAASCVDIIKTIAGKPSKAAFASVYLDGQYGLKGVCLGVPVVIDKRGIRKVLELKLPDSEKQILHKAEENFKQSLNLL